MINIVTTTYTAYVRTNAQIQNTGFTCYSLYFLLRNNVSLQDFIMD